ncbi:MAG: TRAP transporter small permease subunit [Kiloniellales bacterium]|nr:TRAP transporter small permease subunit [Kiloniellales bacterium]MDJ0970329.1 TRAP transporter small permease subunit [Kiloniellales bacterium]
MADALSTGKPDEYLPSGTVLGFRYLAWAIVTTLFVFLANAYLKFWLGWPGVVAATSGGGTLAWLQVLFYVGALAGPAAFVIRTKGRSLRRDAEALTAMAAYITRAAFWMVFLVGIADAAISFLRVEGLLEGIVGQQLTQDLGRNQFRGPFVHMPLIALSLVVAAFTRTLGFTWLALLVVLAELQIVVSRFVFSYEQAFMGDLVRFWYGGLFLFASAHTLLEDGHVRVDVLYAGFTERTKGLVNAAGALILGIPLCWVVLAIGFGQRSSIIASPLLAFEVTQAGFGMYVKYLLAGFLAIFAASMMIQFASTVLEGIADYRGEPGKRRVASEIVH